MLPHLRKVCTSSELASCSWKDGRRLFSALNGQRLFQSGLVVSFAKQILQDRDGFGPLCTVHSHSAAFDKVLNSPLFLCFFTSMPFLSQLVALKWQPQHQYNLCYYLLYFIDKFSWSSILKDLIPLLN